MTDANLINLAKLAREIAMDILPIDKILDLNKIDDNTWERIEADPKFAAMLQDMITEWNATGNARSRIRVKSQTAVEALLEVLIHEVQYTDAPLAQKVDTVRQIARLGELEGREIGTGGASDRVSIVINLGSAAPEKPPMIIEAIPNKEIANG